MATEANMWVMATESRSPKVDHDNRTEIHTWARNRNVDHENRNRYIDDGNRNIKCLSWQQKHTVCIMATETYSVYHGNIFTCVAVCARISTQIFFTHTYN